MNVAEQIERAWLSLRAPTPVKFEWMAFEDQGRRSYVGGGEYHPERSEPAIRDVLSGYKRWMVVYRMSDGSLVIVRRRHGR